MLIPHGTEAASKGDASHERERGKLSWWRCRTVHGGRRRSLSAPTTTKTDLRRQRWSGQGPGHRVWTEPRDSTTLDGHERAIYHRSAHVFKWGSKNSANKNKSVLLVDTVN